MEEQSERSKDSKVEQQKGRSRRVARTWQRLARGVTACRKKSRESSKMRRSDDCKKQGAKEGDEGGRRTMMKKKAADGKRQKTIKS